MDWPQIVIMIALGTGLLVAANLHGKPKVGGNRLYNFWSTLGYAVFWIIVLYFGGFWN